MSWRACWRDRERGNRESSGRALLVFGLDPTRHEFGGAVVVVIQELTDEIAFPVLVTIFERGFDKFRKPWKPV